MINNSADFDADQSKSATRIGVANLTRMSFNGVDLVPLWNELLLSVVQRRSHAAAVMDMSCLLYTSDAADE